MYDIGLDTCIAASKSPKHYTAVPRMMVVDATCFHFLSESVQWHTVVGKDWRRTVRTACCPAESKLRCPAVCTPRTIDEDRQRGRPAAPNTGICRNLWLFASSW